MIMWQICKFQQNECNSSGKLRSEENIADCTTI